MKTKIFTLVISSLLLFGTTHAKDLQEYTAEERANAVTEWMDEHLDLQEEELSEVADLNLKYAQMIDEILGNHKSPFTIRKKVKAAMKEKEEELRKILDDESFERYETSKSEMREGIQNKLESLNSDS